MDILLENIDLFLIAVIMIIAAVIFARRGQIDLLRELIVGITGSVRTEELYARLPALTKMLVSGKTVGRLVSESRQTEAIKAL